MASRWATAVAVLPAEIDVSNAPGVLRVLAVTGLDAVVPVYPRLEEALAAAPRRSGQGQPTAS